ncbi:peptidylprolyl isomerase [Rhodohalobacter sulfatireducens]|uniref:Periplasmic chaperone PpiD n=1 Tax=Rhodohalobacter sulfatireducens TaxID=2911366 RepID=A0ABS9KAJ2_9BACT|nr:peptidylprolyl isomerase [Rhodohalobacter sulfatireducens]MCG2587867.1 SurA N-terminal domain-containing protein [Rhodohalobacter sulfatireducens]MDR9365466.1 SurA N-terminal domain-containing protein [Balneolaceae bacterium]MDR9408814.1 SurA N-terminal domain-containing protein [Balneolaceae bacterium]
MRNSTASILWILIFSFGILWVLADTQVFDALTVGPRSLGSVNGEAISLNEYNQRVNFYTEQYQQRTGGSVNPEMRATYENQAWEDLVAAELIQQKMNEIGITVTDNELLEMVTGENPAPFIRQQFQAEDGTIDRIALRAAIESPENSEAWIQVEQQLRDTRRQEKMSSYISSGLKVNSLEVRNEYIKENSYANIRYLRFPYADIPAEEITATEEELRAYYQDNQDRFERAETYRFRYVSWDKTPTAQDTTNIVNEVADLGRAFANAQDDSLFLDRYGSTVDYTGAYVPADEIREEYQPVVDLDVGEVSDVVMINGDPHVFKKVDQRGNEIKFGVLSYPVVADPIATIDRLAEQASEFEFYASSEGFMQEAERRELEVQEGTASKGSSFIPGIGQSQSTLRILESLSEDEISEPIETNNFFLVVQMIQKTPEGPRPFPEVRSQVETLVINEKRKNMMLERVQEMYQNNSGLEAIATASDKEIQEVQDLRMAATRIPDAGREVGVIGEIFDMEQGDLSEPIPGENGVYVIEVTELSEADPANITDTQRQQIQSRLEQQKFMAFNQVFLDQLKAEADIVDNRREMLQ